MQWKDILEILLFALPLLLLAPRFGYWLAHRLDQEQPTNFEYNFFKFFGFRFGPQTAKEYFKDLLIFHLLGLLAFFLIIYGIRLATEPMSWHLALNTAVSFITNTNWQAYSGEVSLAPLMQMLAPTVQNFLSAATGMAVMFALIRGLRNKDSNTVGNYWLDLFRSIGYVLLPLSIFLAFILMSQGVVQTFDSVINYVTLEGQHAQLQLGPVASQLAIKQLGTNGGGHFGVNSAHPFENPTALSNYLQLVAILFLPIALVFTYGEMLGRRKHAWTIFSVMASIYGIGIVVSLLAEHSSNPALQGMPFLEGKEWRFGKTASILWSTATTAASNGSVNAMHSSLSPIAGMVALFNILLGEIIFGGVGAGMYGMVIFILLTLFLCGLMVGRTPEYLGKKIEAYDMKLVLLALIAPSCTVLIGTLLSLVTDVGLSSRSTSGPHGLSEVLYAWGSASNNNGSAFAGLNANTIFYNVGLSIAMLIGRFGVIFPVLWLAQSFSKKKILAGNAGQMSIESWMFGFLLFSIIAIVGALTFFPSLLLGPVLEHLLMLRAHVM
ncbi:MAG: potassium-transporting ATPase subunit A [Bdellovibrionales bacterium GWA2_49_15]|nr:MAG: potassium-transporting ATPase subunit A [Bdellovibrionales bacterium GWA2_49_15]